MTLKERQHNKRQQNVPLNLKTSVYQSKHYRWKRQPAEWETISVNHVYQEGQIMYISQSIEGILARKKKGKE